MYVSLHNRSAFSFGSALTLPQHLAAFAERYGMPAIALTDRAGLYGAVPFQQACEAAGVRPIFGAEMPVAERKMERQRDGEMERAGVHSPTPTLPVSAFSVTLLAMRLRGYGNLCRLISRQRIEDRPLRVEEVCEQAGDLICLVGDGWGADAGRDSRWSGCENPDVRRDSHQHHVGRHGGRPLQALREAFGGRLYVELALHTGEDARAARRRARMADEWGIPVAASCESRCLLAEQALTLRALSSIGTLTLLDAPHPDKPVGRWHLRTPAEMERLFRRRPDALANTLKIAEQCDVRLDLDRNRFPSFDSPDGRPVMQHLRELCIAGCRRRYVEQPPQKGMGGRRPTMDEALRRLERELAIIEQVQYAEYFLVFHEIVQYCRSRGIATLARGSAADSLVCYALGVSHACPFRFDLPFDRFVNPERAKFSKMADIDLDLPWDQRDEVIRWVYDRWGHDRVAMIGCANTFHARAAVAELGKVFGLPAHEVHRTTKLLPHTTAWRLAQAIAMSPETRDVPVKEEPYRTIIAMAVALEGLPRHWAMHPCGLVVSPEPLTELVPVQPSPKGPLVAQFEMDPIEELGFVKIDLLGQAGLSVLRDTVAEIERTGAPAALRIADCELRIGSETPLVNSQSAIRNPQSVLDLERDVDYSDSATWDLIARGQARGVHHIESPAMTSLLVQSNCRDIDCLTTIVALIRPGAANQGKKEMFCRRHQGFEPASYAHPSLVPVLEKTHGLMVFEEHILQIAVEFAGMNLGRADVLRRGLNKENRPLIEEMRAEFRTCARARGRTEAEIEAVWAILDDFAGFMFNKAHSAEYAVEAFQGAWLKLRWPAHYLAAILSNYRGFYAHSPTLPQIVYVMEALRLGIGFRPPCVNASRPRFSVERGGGKDRKSCKEVTRGSGGVKEPLAPASGLTPHSQVVRESCLPLALQSTGLAPPPALDAAKGCQGSRAHQSHFHRLRVLHSGMETQFSILNSQSIRVPISHIKGMPEAFSERWWTERQKGPFASLADFAGRCRPGEAESLLLLDSGALDCFGASRPAMFWQVRRLVKGKTERQRDRERERRGDNPLTSILPISPSLRLSVSPSPPLLPFSSPSAPGKESPPVELTLPDVHQVARREMELLGFPITIDPLTYLGRDERGRVIDWSRYVPVERLNEHLGRRVRVCGLMVADRINATAGGNLMKFVTLADPTGFVETMLFPDVYRRFGHLTVSNPILAATGVVEPFENRRGFTLRLESVQPPRRIEN